MRVGLLGVEAVAAVVLEEEAVEAEVSADVARGVDRFVGENRHQDIGVGCADGLKGFDDACVDIGVIEFVDAVVVEEEGQSVGHVLLVVDVSFRIAESSADEHGGPVSDIAGYDRLRKLRLVEVSKHRIDGVAEINTGVDESAVEIECDKAGGGAQHGKSVFEKKDSGQLSSLIQLKSASGFEYPLNRYWRGW